MGTQNKGNKTLKVNKNSEFFLGICKDGIHSSAIVGVIIEGKPKLLARIGKTNYIDHDHEIGNILRLARLAAREVFSSVKAELRAEPIQFKKSEKKSTPLQYYAFSINYDQYCDFITLSSAITKDFKYKDKDGNEKVLKQIYFPNDKAQNVSEHVLKIKKIKENTDELNESQNSILLRGSSLNIFTNNCRQTAIELASMIEPAKTMNQKVSGNFLTSLPFKYDFSGSNSQYFYVLPAPPNVYSNQLETKKYNIAKELYNRMEGVVKKSPDNPETFEKFNALKKLYNKLTGKLNSGSLAETLQAVKKWQGKNEQVIDTLRDQSFLGKLFVSRTSTRKMVDKMIQNLEKDIGNEGKNKPK